MATKSKSKATKKDSIEKKDSPKSKNQKTIVNTNSYNQTNDILNKVRTGLTQEQKQQAIANEEHYRKLYNEIFNFNQTKDFSELCTMLIDGYNNLLKQYQKNSKETGLIIKFAFRDFFLLIFINLKNIFDENEFLKNIHKKVYFSDNYVDIKTFDELIEYCKKQIQNEKK